MFLIPYNQLDESLHNPSVKEYYEIISRKKTALFFKRFFDIALAVVLIVLTSPIMAVCAVIIKCDSRGPVFFRQRRVKQFGEIFRIYKFRTMVVGAESMGSQVTTNRDPRVTRVGSLIRKIRADELPQLFNIISGEMSFVGTRPEVPKYVEQYTNEMKATLLMPPGLTSLASIKFRNENELLTESVNADETYVQIILPEKMKYNLEYLKEFNPVFDFCTLVKTLLFFLVK